MTAHAAGGEVCVFEHHDTLLRLWRERDEREIDLVHVDFHDDLRGLVVDRRRGCAYPTGALARGRAEADPGNFLAHAVLEGRIRRLSWVHGIPGGRAWDSGIVRYESDRFALPHRIRHRLAGGDEVPLEFLECVVDEWRGLRDGQQLSIDWDCFASILLDAAGIPTRCRDFLDRLGSSEPAGVFLVYSPEYSHPSLELFSTFADELASRLGWPVRWLDAELREGRTRPSDVDAGLPSGLLMRLVRFLRRRGIY